MSNSLRDEPNIRLVLSIEECALLDSCLELLNYHLSPPKTADGTTSSEAISDPTLLKLKRLDEKIWKDVSGCLLGGETREDAILYYSLTQDSERASLSSLYMHRHSEIISSAMTQARGSLLASLEEIIDSYSRHNDWEGLKQRVAYLRP